MCPARAVVACPGPVQAMPAAAKLTDWRQLPGSLFMAKSYQARVLAALALNWSHGPIWSFSLLSSLFHSFFPSPSSRSPARLHACFICPFLSSSHWRSRAYAVEACRYEVSSKGDAVQLVFHTPANAVGWCLTVQSLLLSAPWPAMLEQHPRTSLRCMPSAQDLNSSKPLPVLT